MPDRLDLCVAALVVAHVLACPYSKVEESFNMQAMHDMLHHGTHLDAYDHHAFPGVVPRTFLGSVTVTFLASPIHFLLRAVSAPALYSQYLVRVVLGLLSVFAQAVLRHALELHSGRTASQALGLISLTQFHLPFYWSRTLPNTLAMVPTTLAFAAYLRAHAPDLQSEVDSPAPGSGMKQHAVAYAQVLLQRREWWVLLSIGLLTMTAAVLRCDVVILLAAYCAQALFLPSVSWESSFPHRVMKLIRCGIYWGCGSVAVSVFVDSLLWRRVLWPELSVFLFNAVENRSSEYGVSAWHWYWTRALPKATLGALPLCLAALCHRPRRLLQILAPSLFFVCAYSLLPHKELRFVFYAIPPINCAAAIGCAALWEHWRRAGGWQAALLTLAAVGTLLGSAVVALFFLWVSSWNYPGGYAMLALHSDAQSSTQPLPPAVRVHVDNLACISGVTRFTQSHTASPQWSYSKEEGLDLHAVASKGFEYIITADPVPTSMERYAHAYKQVAVVPAYAGIALKWPWPIKLKDSLWVSRRVDET